jgi:hypothetical protein
VEIGSTFGRSVLRCTHGEPILDGCGHCMLELIGDDSLDPVFPSSTLPGPSQSVLRPSGSAPAGQGSDGTHSARSPGSQDAAGLLAFWFQALANSARTNNN